jgi:hypothetical protein
MDLVRVLRSRVDYVVRPGSPVHPLVAPPGWVSEGRNNVPSRRTTQGTIIRYLIDGGSRSWAREVYRALMTDLHHANSLALT